MSDRTAIEWTEATWNPSTGCDKTSPGCDNCYALRLAKRLKAMGSPRYQKDGDPTTSGQGFKLQVHADALATPYGWRSGRLVFVNSMSDLFHDDVPGRFIHRVFDTMASHPRHTFQLLTKRSRRLAAMSPRLGRRVGGERPLLVPSRAFEAGAGRGALPFGRADVGPSAITDPRGN